MPLSSCIRVSLTALATLVLATCRDGSDPDAAEPRGLIVAARHDAIVTMNIDGRDRRSYTGVVRFDPYGQHPTWAGPSRVIVHTLASGSSVEVRLHELDLATGAVRRLTPSADPPPLAREWYPHAAAGWVYFMGERLDGRYEAWRVRPDGGGTERVPHTTPAYDNYYRPTISPDAARLAVSTVVGDTIGVRVFEAATNVAVSPWIGRATAPRWSPDSRQVAFSTPGGGPIRVMNADGSRLRVVSRLHFREWFDWSADGRWLVASDSTGLVLVNVARGTRRPLANTADMWQPAVIEWPGTD